MSDLVVRIYLRGDRELLYVEDLLADAGLRASIDDIAGSNGGVEIYGDDGYVLVDDIVGFVATEFVAAGAEALRAGQNIRYRHKLSDDIAEICISDGMAEVSPEESDTFSASVDELADALENASADYSKLLGTGT